MSTGTSTAVSADGTPIAFRSLGRGPALIVVHGSIATGEQWLPVAEALAGSFTCHLVDRRGRGGSGDAATHSLDAEATDVRAVLDAVGPEAALLAHSYGAVVALQALRSGAEPSAVVLYEPPLPVGGPVAGTALEPFEELVAAGDLDAALALALTDVVRVPAAAVAGLRRGPLWAGMAALTPTWGREFRAIDGLGPGVDRYAAIPTRTLCLVGGATSAHQVAATTALTDVLPDVRTVTMPGEGHFAHVAAPGVVAAAVTEFLLG
jgi:pimeloyl-ACP methyl ester carboxylesterase